MTHDLLRNLIVELGLTVDRVVVTSLRDNTFYAVIEMTAEDGDGNATRLAAFGCHRPGFACGLSDLCRFGSYSGIAELSGDR
jgi:hypothetical protein